MEEATLQAEEPRLRRANLLAGLAFLLAITSLLLPWWGLTASLGGVSGELAPPTNLWGAGDVAKTWAQWITMALVAAAILLLFVRVAAASWRNEPAAFRRDVGIAAVVLLLACASCWLWPVEFPFWGTRTYVDNVTGDPSVVSGMPLLGWWLTIVAAAAAGGAAILGRESA